MGWPLAVRSMAVSSSASCSSRRGMDMAQHSGHGGGSSAWHCDDGGSGCGAAAAVLRTVTVIAVFFLVFYSICRAG